MSDTVSNNAAQHRFELAVDGHIAAAYYKRAGDVIVKGWIDKHPEYAGLLKT